VKGWLDINILTHPEHQDGMLELDEYQTIHTTCFRLAKEEGPLPFRLTNEKAPMYEAKLNSRSIASIKAGSRRGRVDDILEYGIRHVPISTEDLGNFTY
jgi:hypothetical protein